MFLHHFVFELGWINYDAVTLLEYYPEMKKNNIELFILAKKINEFPISQITIYRFWEDWVEYSKQYSRRQAFQYHWVYKGPTEMSK